MSVISLTLLDVRDWLSVQLPAPILSSRKLLQLLASSRPHVAPLHVFQTVNLFVQVLFVKVFSLRPLDQMFPPNPIARAIVALLDGVRIGRNPIVFPVTVFDSSEAIESPLDTTGVRIIATSGTDQCVLHIGLRVVGFHKRLLSQIRVIC